MTLDEELEEAFLKALEEMPEIPEGDPHLRIVPNEEIDEEEATRDRSGPRHPGASWYRSTPDTSTLPLAAVRSKCAIPARSVKTGPVSDPSASIWTTTGVRLSGTLVTFMQTLMVIICCSRVQ
jgi:hypothetical protein